MITFIDGRSGAGKTTRALQLGEELGAPVIHLDDFYPGWHGLEAGVQMTAQLILTGRYTTWDWERNMPGQVRTVDLRGGAVIEGCGAVSAGSLVAAAAMGHRYFCEWWDASEEIRRARALMRDPEYAQFWALWARQEDRFFSRVAPLWGYLEGVGASKTFNGISQG